MTDTAPKREKLEANLPAAGATTDQSTVIGEAPFDATVEAVSFTPTADITGATATHRVLTLINKGADGNGTTSVATLTFDTGVNASDFDEKAFALSGTAANLEVNQGDILAVAETHASTGLANPGGKVQIDLLRA